MGVIAKGIPRGGQGLFTPVSLGYPLSVFNKTLLSKSVWNRPEGGCYVWIPKFRSLCLHTGLVSPDIGSLLQPPVPEFRSGLWQPTSCRSHADFAVDFPRFGASHTKNQKPWCGIPHQGPLFGINTLTDVGKSISGHVATLRLGVDAVQK